MQYNKNNKEFRGCGIILFQEQKISFDFVSVLDFDEKNVEVFNNNRECHAISYRICSDAVIKYRNKKIELASGDLSFVPAGLDYRRCATTEKIIVVHLKNISYNGKEIEVVKIKNKDEMKNIFEKMLLTFREQKPGYILKITSLIYKVLAIAYSQLCDEEYTNENFPETLKLAVAYSRSNYTNSLFSISELAKSANVSEVYLRRLFKEYLGVSPKEFITALRLEYAQSVIETGYYTISDVSWRAGFSDPKYFSTAFKKYYGFSPSSVRK